MNLRVSLLLMITFMVLGTFAFFDPLRRQVKEEERRERDSHVVWLKDRKLESIVVSGKNPPVQFTCAIPAGCAFDGTGDWKLVLPISDNADPSAVGSLASTLINLTQSEKIDFDTPPDPKEFGLDLPQATVELQLKAQKGQPPEPKESVILKFGKASTVGPNVYLSVSGDPKHLFLVPNYLPEMVNKELFHWRNKRLFPGVEGTAISRLGWRNKNLEVRAIRRIESQARGPSKDIWRLEKPQPALASKIMIEGLGSTVIYVAAKAVFPGGRSAPVAKKALSQKPELEIDFDTVAGGTAHKLLLFTKPSADSRGARELLALVDKQDTVYVVDATPFDRFTKGIIEYRQRTILDDDSRAAIDEVHFEFPREKREIVLKLNGKDWAFVSGEKPKGALSQERIDGFLDGLRDSDYKAMFPVAGASAEATFYKTQPADLSIELKSGGKPTAQARFTVFERKWALTESEGDVRTLGEAFLKVLPVRLEDLSQAANQTVVVQPEKGSANGNNPQFERIEH